MSACSSWWRISRLKLYSNLYRENYIELCVFLLERQVTFSHWTALFKSLMILWYKDAITFVNHNPNMSITKSYFRNFFTAARKTKSRLKTERYNYPTDWKSRNAAKVRKLFLLHSFKAEEREVMDADECVPCGFCGVNLGQYPVSVDYIKCQICVKWHHEICVRVRPVYLCAPPCDGSYSIVVLRRHISRVAFNCNCTEMLKILKPNLFHISVFKYDLWETNKCCIMFSVLAFGMTGV